MSQTDQTAGYQKTAADHFHTAEMNHASALAAIVDCNNGTIPKAEAALLFDRHMRMAELHARLADTRIAAVQLLLQEDARRDRFGEMLTSRQRDAIAMELDSWGHRLAP